MDGLGTVKCYQFYHKTLKINVIQQRDEFLDVIEGYCKVSQDQRHVPTVNPGDSSQEYEWQVDFQGKETLQSDRSHSYVSWDSKIHRNEYYKRVDSKGMVINLGTRTMEEPNEYLLIEEKRRYSIHK